MTCGSKDTRRNKKKYSVIALIICLCMLGMNFTGCSVSSKHELPAQIKIGVITYDEYDTFITAMTKAMHDFCKTKEKETGVAILLDVVSAKGSQLTQNDQAEKFISKGYDVICINLVDRTDPTVIIDKAKAADIPVIFFNRELVKEDLERWNKLYYVGSKPEEAGIYQAQIIINELANPEKFDKIDVNKNGIIQYVMLEGEAGHQDALIRTKICTDTLKNAGVQLEKIGDEIANWNKDQAYTKMCTLFEKYPIQIEMVIANNDDMALGAIEAVEDTNPAITPYIVGVNGTNEALEAVRVRKLNGTVYNDYIGQANAILTMAYMLAVGEGIPDKLTIDCIDGEKSVSITDRKYLYLPHSIITYDNVQKYIRWQEVRN